MKIPKTMLTATAFAVTAGVAQADILHLDDVIASFSMCIGNDCVNGESFGFDSLRLKENNLRIHFDDTSTSASFPRNDWRIRINDTSNGGGSYFALEDATTGRTPFRVEAGARANALYIEDDGDIGIGTATPVVDLHVKSGNTPTLRLEQDGTSGFTPQTWDVAGNETNFFVRDATNGSTLPIRLRPGAPTSAIDIASDGDVGLGTTSPDGNLDIEDNGVNLRLTHTGTNASTWDITNNSDTGRLTVSDDASAARIPFKFGLGAANNLLRLGIVNTSTVDVNGTLQVTGSVVVDGTTVHPDYVFTPSYALESIEDHAAFMWSRKHLPALNAADSSYNGAVDLVAHQMGILEELEKAHIYIEQLNSTIIAFKNQSHEKNEQIDHLESRLAQLEKTLGN